VLPDCILFINLFELDFELQSTFESIEKEESFTKLTIVEKIVRERLTKSEFPRMWSALGDNTKLNGQFSSAFVALRKHFAKSIPVVKQESIMSRTYPEPWHQEIR